MKWLHCCCAIKPETLSTLFVKNRLEPTLTFFKTNCNLSINSSLSGIVLKFL